MALTIYDDGRKATVTLKGQAVPDANGVFLFWFDGTEYQLEAPPSIMEIADSHVLYAMAHASDNYFPSWADITLYKDGKAIHTETVHFGEE